jgi:S1-C subfamily serine protease
MTDTADPLVLYSDRVASLVETATRSVVAVHGGGRRSTSAIHWRPGILVTAEEALEREDDIAVTLPDGQRVAATLAGRDPSTDVAVLRFPPDGLPVASRGDAAALRTGHFVLAIGRHEGGPIASHGIAGFIGGAWQSQRGGTIDHLLRLDLNLSPAAEGGALIDSAGRVLGMTVLGPRRRALAIPASTVDRAVDQLLAKGHVARGYFGAALQRVRLGGDTGERGVLAVGIEADGPAARAGLLVGDAIVGWNGAAVTRVREIMRLLGTDSVGKTVELGLVRGGQKLTLGITIGERPLR